jgi:hypothetical protein
VPKSINIQSDYQDWAVVIGDYRHLPHCATAFTSLYKKSIEDNSMYLFLDPDPIGRLDHDSFVFSHDHTRKHYGESRRSLVRVHPSWRSWHVEDDRVHIITTTVPNVWAPAVMTLVSASVLLNVDFLKKGVWLTKSRQVAHRRLPA